jgi:hypothetical protein
MRTKRPEGAIGGSRLSGLVAGGMKSWRSDGGKLSAHCWCSSHTFTAHQRVALSDSAGNLIRQTSLENRRQPQIASPLDVASAPPRHYAQSTAAAFQAVLISYD